MASYCECDYDCVGDPPAFVKTSKHCPVHDECLCCATHMGSRVVDGEWLCEECASEIAKEEA